MSFRKSLLSAALTAVMCSTAGTASAVLITDAPDDLLPTFAGPAGPDLDVLSVDVTLDVAAQTLNFFAQEAGAIGTTPGSLFVFGLNRGQGTEFFQQNTPQIGPGVLFDAVLVLNPDTSALFIDLTPGAPAPVALPTGTVDVAGNTLSATLPLSLFPSTGFAPQDYTYNFWPRVGLTPTDNTQVSDLAPDTGNAPLDVVVPGTVAEPGTGALLAVAAGGLVAVRRRAGTRD